jgi:hypothetical protein
MDGMIWNDTVDVKVANFVVASKFFKGASIFLSSRLIAVCRKSHHRSIILFLNIVLSFFKFIYSQNFDIKGYSISVSVNQCFTLFSNQIHFRPFNKILYTVIIAVISCSILFCYSTIKLFLPSYFSRFLTSVSDCYFSVSPYNFNIIFVNPA